ncbi:antibiotic biosynthesis monooxygenase [Methylovorus menthalis]|uniref:antibiotic biosynthesis monooxygenase family protein n=1 Tax=Methylovorus menthalis TaxID=1002227 RepID=UPI001E2BCBE0|nr:antibiotic biosynthesis monooxygenase [Methylovorus menthalis]MCB4811241.1 antibiotic biosynthesis monooxygenase [Methylovorus menthalis]
MYSATFIFDKKQFNEAFYALDNAIAEAARQTSGYLGEESWENPSSGLIANTYYWKTMDGLQALMQHPKHLEAKAAQANWLNGYQVIISEVLRTYGDGKINHPTSSSSPSKG